MRCAPGTSCFNDTSCEPVCGRVNYTTNTVVMPLTFCTQPPPLQICDYGTGQCRVPCANTTCTPGVEVGVC